MYVVAIESSLANEYAMTSPGFMTVILVVIMGAFVCMALSVCRRLFARAMRRRGAPGGFCSAAGTSCGADAAMAGDARRRGASLSLCAVVDAIPRVVFGSEEWDSGKWSVEDAVLGLKLGAAFEARRFTAVPAGVPAPAFHEDCIEGCARGRTQPRPNCRASWCPLREDVERARAPRGGAASKPRPRRGVWRRPRHRTSPRIADDGEVARGS